MEWNPLLREQVDWLWRGVWRPRLEGLTDEQYLCEPVPGAWSVRPRAEAVTPMADGAGEMVIDWAYPEPDPPR